METTYNPKSMTYSEAMSRIVKQFRCSRKEAYELMNILIDYKNFKLEDDDNK